MSYPTRCRISWTAVDGYTTDVTKRLIDVDDTLLEQASGVLRTRTMKDTVNQALGEVVRSELRRRHADRLVAMDGLEIDDSEVMAGAWRS